MRITDTKGGKPFIYKFDSGRWLNAEVDNGFVFGTGNLIRSKQGHV